MTTHDLNITDYELTKEQMMVILGVLQLTIFRGMPAAAIHTQREIANDIHMDEANFSRNLRTLRTAHVIGIDDQSCWFIYPSSTWKLRRRQQWTAEHDQRRAEIKARPIDEATWFPRPPDLNRALADTILPIAQPAAEAPAPTAGPDFAALRRLVEQTSPAPRLDRAARCVAPLVEKTNRAETPANKAPTRLACPPLPPAPQDRAPARAFDRDRTILFDQEAGTDRIDRSTPEDEAYLAEKLSQPTMRKLAVEVTGAVPHMTEAFRALLRQNPERLKQLIGECLSHDIRNKPAWLNVAMRKALQEQKP